MGRSAQLESLRTQLAAQTEVIARLRSQLAARDDTIDKQDSIIKRQRDEIKGWGEIGETIMRVVTPVIEAAQALVHYGDTRRWADMLRTDDLIQVSAENYRALVEAVHTASVAAERLEAAKQVDA